MYELGLSIMLIMSELKWNISRAKVHLIWLIFISIWFTDGIYNDLALQYVKVNLILKHI